MYSKNWPAPAKLNLMLRITGRRDDGYHELQTVFQFIDYADSLSFFLRDDGIVRRINPVQGVSEEQDLSIRAAQLLRQMSGTPHGVDISINKVLPMGAGLGGGSSDAATVLVALNHLWKLGLTKDDLATLGLQLGADVPVFVRGEAAWAEGVGEILTPLILPEPWFLVVIVPCHVETSAVFLHEDLTRDAVPIRIRSFLSGDTENSCAAVVKQAYPLVGKALAWLGRHASARMSGTGCSVFAEFEQRKAAEAVLTELPDEWHGFIVKGKNISPLMNRLAQAKTL
ncbi:MAG: 4-(cytidine 5'-diphospho)-2-C-methyl-D-erythritol kinase [Gammaproteobacteria bacterium]|nr:4-(cytidine 5'-diphospho)-2-C-methyl-D-erythritol kinase [Gammaproteobacteria bacterium]